MGRRAARCARATHTGDEKGVKEGQGRNETGKEKEKRREREKKGKRKEGREGRHFGDVGE